jgi:uracil-DNA glycosylase
VSPAPHIQTRAASFVQLAGRVASCERCPRLRRHCLAIARVKRRAFLHEAYWGLPVPGFGDPGASLLIIGLAPAAHGANRTGRMFTGDSSGSWLYEALHRYGWANQPQSVGTGDGLRLKGAYVTAAARCAPPGNKPTPREIANCREYLLAELALLGRVRIVLCLGRIALDAYLATLAARGTPWLRPKPEFAHDRLHEPPPGTALPRLVTSYHPSRQNTQTGRLTREMFHSVFARCREAIEDSRRAPP